MWTLGGTLIDLYEGGREEVYDGTGESGIISEPFAMSA